MLTQRETSDSEGLDQVCLQPRHWYQALACSCRQRDSSASGS